jgi:Dolichyl-phosphate-mannose-protein mannosyltransferase
MQPSGLRRWAPIAAVIACYLLLCLGRALTTTPWNDEAWYSSPSWSLIHYGTTGTPLLETTGKFWRGINQRTYWVVPLQFFAQVPWFKVFGFSLLSARFFASAWGLVGLLSWGLIVKRFTGNPLMGFWTMVLLAVDYQFVSQMSLDRMDAMSLGLASLAILSYLEFRENNLTLAVLLSQTAVAACGMTHPTPGIPVMFAVAFLAIYYDRRRIGIKLLLLAAVPYLILGGGWYAYISAAPDLFRAQFLGNVTDIDRLGGIHHPLHAIIAEFGRYTGMGGFTPGAPPLYRIKILSIAIYLIAAVGLLLNRETRQDPGIRPLLGVWLVYVLMMTFYDNTKDPKYGVHLVPVYDALIAVWFVWIWQHRPKQHWIPIAAAAIFFTVNGGGLLYSIKKDDYHRAYLPVAQYLKDHAQSGDLILAGSEFGFALGFDRNMVDDSDFTYRSHKTPEFVVMSPNYRAFTESHRRSDPALYNFEQKLLTESFQPVYTIPGYVVFERRK